MSLVTNIMLSVSIAEEHMDEGEHPLLVRLNKDFFGEYGDLVDNSDCRDAWGGYKAPECTVFAGAFNYLNLEEMMGYLRRVPWQYPHKVQVFIMEQEDDVWRIEGVG